MKPILSRGTLLAATAAVVLIAACKDSTGVTDQNAISASAALAGGLTRPTMQLLVSGLVNRDRNNLDIRFLTFTMTMQRDIYRIDDAEPRFITQTLGGPPDPSGFLGGGVWTQFYSAIRTANTIIDSLPTATDATQPYSAQELSAARGFARTFKALNLYRVIETRDSLGAPIDVDIAVDAKPADIRCKPNVLAYIAALLDSAATDLSAAGSASFPFTLPSGFSSNGTFNTPAGFLKFNRGLAGKIQFYRAMDHQAPAATLPVALADLNASFLDASGNFDAGVYHTYSTAPGETANPLADNALHFNNAVGDSIQPGDRRASKIIPCDPNTQQCSKSYGSSRGVISSKYNPLYAAPNAANLARPLPILRNAELVLLRAQVEIEMGNFVAATADINAVRQGEGGLAPIPVLTDKESARSAVLYEKRYSLLLEGEQRLVDLRAYGRFNGANLAKELKTDKFLSVLPIPKTESDARGGNITPVCK